MTAVAIRTCGGSWPKPRPSRNYGTCFGRRFNLHRWKRRWGSGHAAAPRTDARIGLTIFVLGLLTWASYLGDLPVMTVFAESSVRGSSTILVADTFMPCFKSATDVG